MVVGLGLAYILCCLSPKLLVPWFFAIFSEKLSWTNTAGSALAIIYACQLAKEKKKEE
jgi:hypothetical protein